MFSTPLTGSSSQWNMLNELWIPKNATKLSNKQGAPIVKGSQNSGKDGRYEVVKNSTRSIIRPGMNAGCPSRGFQLSQVPNDPHFTHQDIRYCICCHFQPCQTKSRNLTQAVREIFVQTALMSRYFVVIHLSYCNSTWASLWASAWASPLTVCVGEHMTFRCSKFWKVIDLQLPPSSCTVHRLPAGCSLKISGGLRWSILSQSLFQPVWYMYILHCMQKLTFVKVSWSLRRPALGNRLQKLCLCRQRFFRP